MQQSPTQSQMAASSEQPANRDEAQAQQQQQQQQQHLEFEEDEEEETEQNKKRVSSSSSSLLSLCSKSPSESPLHLSPSPPHLASPPLYASNWIEPTTPMALPNRSFPAEPLTWIQDHQHGVVSQQTQDPEPEASGSAAAAAAGSSSRRKLRPDLSDTGKWSAAINRRGAKRALLGFRVCVLVFCLISFGVMAADRQQGWALDSFYRYKEFRYCLGVNVLGFAYSALQVYDLVRFFTTRKHVVDHSLRHYFDFLMDQILSYLLMSAASSAATRVDDWVSNWGKDKFPNMASASVGLSFAAFAALACSSLISGYILFSQKPL